MTNYPDLKHLIQGLDGQLNGITDSMDSRAFITTPEPMVKYILVEIGSRSLAITIDSLAEVGAVPMITFLPNLPEWILGIMNIRSEIISMVDLSVFLGEVRESGVFEKKLVLRDEKIKVGIGVDVIAGTVTKSMNDIKPSEIETEGAFGKMLFEKHLLIDGKDYSVLNVQKFLTHPRLVNYGKESLD